jgi:hypothetical protein
MISEQITQDYLEQENDLSDKVMKVKVALFLISLTGLLLLTI